MKLMVISGRSGSGKSVALRVLEDLGFYCVDNLPVDLLPAFISANANVQQDIAVSIDVRNWPQCHQEISSLLKEIRQHIEVSVIFIDANDETLIKRYSETRRLHPLSRNNMTLEQAIHHEHELLQDLKKHADIVIDSTQFSIHDLSESLRNRIIGKPSQDLVMVFESFGFKHGLPSDADFVFDVRFLPNPHWIATLRPQTGLDEEVQQYLSGHTEVTQLIYQIRTFIENWLPMLEKNNRSYLTVAIGCTGGQHRSVYVTQQLGEYFQSKRHKVQIRHRSLEKYHAKT
jgi:UPF0042 nucleotide-binding protein